MENTVHNRRIVALVIAGVALGSLITFAGIYAAKEFFNPLPDHPSIQQIRDVAEKCITNQVPEDVCTRLDSIEQIKLRVCDSRLNGKIASDKSGSMSRVAWLEFCDERFPDMR